jgi:hypothetical protein
MPFFLRLEHFPQVLGRIAFSKTGAGGVPEDPRAICSEPSGNLLCAAPLNRTYGLKYIMRPNVRNRDASYQGKYVELEAVEDVMRRLWLPLPELGPVPIARYFLKRVRSGVTLMLYAIMADAAGILTATACFRSV